MVSVQNVISIVDVLLCLKIIVTFVLLIGRAGGKRIQIMFKLFDYLNKALVHLESRNDYVSKTARIWPSEASAVLLEPEATSIVGGCHRRVFYRLTGEKTTSQMDAVGGRRVRTGKSVEEDVTFQAMEAGLHVASGVRMYVPAIDLAFELDLVVIDPSNNHPVICENKSIYGYVATKAIMGNAHQKGKPKLEHVIQTLIYINEIRTGGHLKQVIASGLADFAAGNKRNRIRVSQENLDMVKDDAQIYGKICYETRDTCETCEFDIEIYEDFDGLHYPVINGDVWKIFTLESIYERFEIIQGYFNRAQKEALARLETQGITRPVFYASDEVPEAPEGWKQQERAFWDRVGEEMRRLGPEFLPPAEYEWQYSGDKIKLLRSKGLIADSKWKEWDIYQRGKRRKPGTPHIGDWMCSYCPFKWQCIPLQNPELAGMCSDLAAAAEEEEGKE